MKKILSSLFVVASFAGVSAQNNLCSTADPFCSSNQYSFPAGVNSGTAEAGPNYGCLGTQPNPAWYFMQVSQSGNIDITMQSTPLVDIDFICYGPFSSLANACSQLTAGNTVDCSYSTAATEFCNIPNAQVGEFYLLLITNYSNTTCNVNFSQTGGVGATDCSILAPTVSNNGPLCEGDLLQLSAATVPGAVTYTWTGPGNFSSTDQNPIINPATTANSGTYMLIVTDGVTTDTAFTTVTVYPVPTATLNYTDTICAGGQVQLQGSGSVPGPGNGLIYQYDLDNNGVYEITSSTGDTLISSYFVIAGNYTVGFRVTSPGGCYDELDFIVRVYANPAVELTANSLEVCRGTSINLLAESNIINPPSLPSTLVTFRWDYDADGILDANDPGTGTNTNKQSAQSVLYNTPGSYYAYVTVTTSGQCSGTDSVQVVVHDLPVAGFSSPDVCGGTDIVLTDSSVIGQPDYLTGYSWSISDANGVVYTDNTSLGDLQTGLSPGTYTATLIVTSDKGCADTVSSTFSVYPEPVADFSYIMSCFKHNTFISEASGGTEPFFLDWDVNGDGESDSDMPTFEYVFDDAQDQDVTFTVTDANNCVSDTTITVSVKDGVNNPEMPNVMALTSPVGNNKLDFEMFAPGFNDCIDYTIAIFNRWGIKVYEAVNNISNPDLNCNACFTGKTSTGSTLEPGTYYWVLRGSGDEGQYDIEKNGTLTIFE